MSQKHGPKKLADGQLFSETEQQREKQAIPRKDGRSSASSGTSKILDWYMEDGSYSAYGKRLGNACIITTEPRPHTTFKSADLLWTTEFPHA